MSKIEETPCSTVQEFWDYLSPDKHKLCNFEHYFFRGQADSEWGLTPSVLRKKKDTPRMSDMQVFFELIQIASFIKYCDMAKLPLPHDSIEFRKKTEWIQDEFALEPSKWPSTDLCYILALMQHFGIETRLLDWTIQPLVAAYFAGKQLLEHFFEWQNRIESKNIAVWILYPGRLPSYGVEVLSIPPSNNRNMYAQSGRFTLLRQSGIRGQPYTGAGCLKELIEKKGMSEDLKLVTLPAKFVVELMEKCDAFGINDATIFPDYSGVLGAVKTNQLLFEIKQIVDPDSCGLPL